MVDVRRGEKKKREEPRRGIGMISCLIAGKRKRKEYDGLPVSLRGKERGKKEKGMSMGKRGLGFTPDGKGARKEGGGR